MKCVTTLDVAAPIDKVFALVDDPEKLKLWLDGLEETTSLRLRLGEEGRHQVQAEDSGRPPARRIRR
jgi:uncharacterized protein YndB with AHSA1/START domain